MQSDKFTALVRNAIGAAQSTALAANHQKLTAEHVLAALLKDDNIHTTSKNMKMVQPDIVVNKSNPSYKEFIVNHGCQNVLCQFQLVDENLKKYEEFFNDMNGGIVPLSSALKYFTK